MTCPFRQTISPFAIKSPAICLPRVEKVRTASIAENNGIISMTQKIWYARYRKFQLWAGEEKHPKTTQLLQWKDKDKDWSRFSRLNKLHETTFFMSELLNFCFHPCAMLTWRHYFDSIIFQKIFLIQFNKRDWSSDSRYSHQELEYSRPSWNFYYRSYFTDDMRDSTSLIDKGEKSLIRTSL